MHDPPFATIEAMSGYRAPVWPDDPPAACVTLTMLLDMHEAMDVEDEMIRRTRAAAEKKRKA